MGIAQIDHPTRPPTQPLSLQRVVYRLLPLWPLLLPAGLLLPSLGLFPYPRPEAVYSDLVVSHLPNALFLRQALFKQHLLPLWSPLILSGHPFAANPLSGLWYPPGWFALVLPLPLGFNLLAILHLVWGGLGMYRLLRFEGLRHPAALFGGLAFAGLPKLFAHYGAGHLTLLYVVTWTPWLLLSLGQALRPPPESPSTRSWLRKALGQPAVLVALILLADSRWGIYAWGAAVFYALASGRAFAGSRLGAHRTMGRERLGSWLRPVYYLARQTCLAALLAAPLLLPLGEFARLSSRSGLTQAERLQFSLPPEQLLGLAFPAFGGFHEWMLYPGAVVLVLGLLAILVRQDRSSGKHWVGLAALTLLIALGSNLPLLQQLWRAPGLDLLRVPSRALFLTGLSCAALAAVGVDHLLWGETTRSERRRITLGLAGLSGFGLSLAAGVWFLIGILPLSFAWGAAFLVASSAWMGLHLAGRLRARSWFLGLVIMCVADLGVVDQSLYAGREPGLVVSQGQEVAEYLASHDGPFRVYSPSYSLPQQTAARAGLELADGVDPLQLESYAAYMETATGVPRQGYSVTLPPMQRGDPRSDNRSYRPDPRWLGALNVRFVLAEYDLPVQGLVLREQFGETRIYENQYWLPRAWIQPREAGLGEQAQAAVITSRTPNRIEIAPVQVEPGQTAWLVLSELDYPGWRVWVDGREAEIRAAGGLLRAVLLTEGTHRVAFAFQPRSLYAGLGLSLFGWLWLAIGQRRKRVQTTDEV